MNEESPILDSSFETSFTSRDYKSIENSSTDYGKSTNGQPSHPSSGNTLLRNMKFKHGFSFVVGAIIGSGIFITPSLVARQTSNLFLALVAWILPGGLALLGALCYCEMVSVVQKTGGSYIFILDCYGKAAGFIVSWTNAMICEPCGANIVLLTFGLYSCAPFFKDHESAEYLWCSKLVGLSLMVIIVIINCLGSKISAAFQVCFISAQMVVFAIIIFLGIYSAATTNTIINLSPAVVFNNTVEGLSKDLPSFGIALLNALYCFYGFASIAYIVEEVENPSQTIPLIAFTSIPFVSFVYLIINIAFGAALTYSEIRSSNVVASELARKVGGDTCVYFVSFFVAISVVPSLSVAFYNVPRMIMSSAREKQFPSVFALIHRQRRTPIPAICFLALMTTIVTFIDLDMETLIQFCSIAVWFEYVIAFSTILVNRYKRPYLHRTYKTWITTPIFMMIIPLIMLLLAFAEKPLSTLCIVLFMMLGMPIYYICLHKRWLSFLPMDRICLWFMKHLPFVICEEQTT